MRTVAHMWLTPTGAVVIVILALVALFTAASIMYRLNKIESTQMFMGQTMLNLQEHALIDKMADPATPYNDKAEALDMICPGLEDPGLYIQQFEDVRLSYSRKQELLRRLYEQGGYVVPIPTE